MQVKRPKRRRLPKKVRQAIVAGLMAMPPVSRSKQLERYRLARLCFYSELDRGNSIKYAIMNSYFAATGSNPNEMNDCYKAIKAGRPYYEAFELG